MLLGNIWLLSTFVNSSCDIKINIEIVQNCCRNLAVKGLSTILVQLILNFHFCIENLLTHDTGIATKEHHWKVKK